MVCGTWLAVRWHFIQPPLLPAYQLTVLLAQQLRVTSHGHPSKTAVVLGLLARLFSDQLMCPQVPT